MEENMWTKREMDQNKSEEPMARESMPTSSPKPSGKLGYIGESIFIKGELTGNEDLTIEGRVEGKIELKDHHLTIGGPGKVNAEILAKSVTITGEVVGNVRADERIEISNHGRLKGNIASPRITIADGAHFKGSVDMDGKSSPAVEPMKKEERSPAIKEAGIK
jgi:cytoskeletal protein CcmA (bactofilin family)